ncbi:MAG: hypothetical protein KIT27_09925 [Legionellales bacterium]|nr:hypothetical protein [Legionellales bacterium]
MAIKRCNLFQSGNEHGVSLIELMLSMGLSLLLILAAIVIYQQLQQVEALQSALSLIDHNGRLTLETLRTAIYSSGFSGCRFHPLTYDNHDSLNRDTMLTLNPNPPYDIIIRAMDPEATVVTLGEKNEIITTSEFNYKKDSLIVISDCEHAEVVKINFKQQRQHQQILYVEPELMHHYDNTALVGNFLTLHYFIQPDPTDHNTSTLYEKINDAAPQALLAPVDGFYVRAQTEGVFHDLNYIISHHLQSQIKALAISVLLSSTQKVHAVAQDFYYREWHFHDRYLHRVWSTLVRLRNA